MEKYLKPQGNIFIGLSLLVTHEIAYAHDPIKYMLIAGAFLLIPGAIAASIAKQKRVWWFLASIPLMALSVWLAFTMRTINPYISSLAISSHTSINLAKQSIRDEQSKGE
jgi:hypothetical protein